MHNTKPPSTGTITIKQEALSNAVTQFNYYSGGKYIFYDKTTVWVSKAVYNALINKKTIAIKPSGVNEVLRLVKKEKYSLKVNNNHINLKTLVAVTDKGSYFRILDNPYAPIILQMKLDFSIQVEEIW
jgi:hypothetical protein